MTGPLPFVQRTLIRYLTIERAYGVPYCFADISKQGFLLLLSESLWSGRGIFFSRCLLWSFLSLPFIYNETAFKRRWHAKWDQNRFFISHEERAAVPVNFCLLFCFDTIVKTFNSSFPRICHFWKESNDQQRNSTDVIECSSDEANLAILR